MLRRIYILRDMVSGLQIGGLIVEPNDECARRYFADICQQVPQVRDHAADYELVRAAAIQPDGVIVEWQDGPVTICSGADILNERAREAAVQAQQEMFDSVRGVIADRKVLHA